MTTKKLIQLISDSIYDNIRKNNKTLYFIEFLDGSWLMEDEIHTTLHPQFALPFKSKIEANEFIKISGIRKNLKVKVTEHYFY